MPSLMPIRVCHLVVIRVSHLIVILSLMAQPMGLKAFSVLLFITFLLFSGGKNIESNITLQPNLPTLMMGWKRCVSEEIDQVYLSIYEIIQCTLLVFTTFYTMTM